MRFRVFSTLTVSYETDAADAGSACGTLSILESALSAGYRSVAVQVRSVEAHPVALDAQLAHDNAAVHLEGCLPDHKEIYRPLDGFRRWKRIPFDALRHAGDCVSVPSTSTTIIRSDALPRMEWDVLQQIEARLPELRRHPTGPSVAIEIREHRVWCPGCEAAEEGQSATVIVTWPGKSMRREYALGSSL